MVTVEAGARDGGARCEIGDRPAADECDMDGGGYGQAAQGVLGKRDDGRLPRIERRGRERAVEVGRQQ
jgi:hypothetical protein